MTATATTAHGEAFDCAARSSLSASNIKRNGRREQRSSATAHTAASFFSVSALLAPSPSVVWSSTQRSFLFGGPVEGSGVDASSSASKAKGRGIGRAVSHRPSARTAAVASSASRKRRRSAAAAAVIDSAAARLRSLRTSIHELDVEARKLATARRSLLHSYHQLHPHTHHQPQPTQPDSQTLTNTSRAAADNEMGTTVAVELEAAAALSSAGLLPCPVAVYASQTACAASSCRGAALPLRCSCVRHRLRDPRCRPTLSDLTNTTGSLSLDTYPTSVSSQSVSPPPLPCPHVSLWRLSSAAPLPSLPFVPFLSAMFLHNKYATIDFIGELSTRPATALAHPKELSSAQPSACSSSSSSAVRVAATIGEVSASASEKASITGIDLVGSSSYSPCLVAAAAVNESPTSSSQAQLDERISEHMAQPHVQQRTRDESTCAPPDDASASYVAIAGAARQPSVLLREDDVRVPSTPTDRSHCDSLDWQGSQMACPAHDVVLIDCDDDSSQRAYEVGDPSAMTSPSVSSVLRVSDGYAVLPVHRTASLSALLQRKTSSVCPQAGLPMCVKRTISLPSTRAALTSQAKQALHPASHTTGRSPLSPLSHGLLNRRQTTYQPVSLALPQQHEHARHADLAVLSPQCHASLGKHSSGGCYSLTNHLPDNTCSSAALPASASPKAIITQLPVSSTAARPRAASHPTSAQSTPSAATSPSTSRASHTSAAAVASTRSVTSSVSPPTAAVPAAAAVVTAAGAAVTSPASSFASSSSPSAAPTLVPLSSAQRSLSFSALHAAFTLLFGSGSLPLFVGCGLGELQRWMAELGLKTKSKTQMADKLTRIFQHYQLAAVQPVSASRQQQRRDGSGRLSASQPLRSDADSSAAPTHSASDVQCGNTSPPPLLSASVAGRLRAFIRHHSTLYLRVLLLQPVDLQSLLVCCNGAGLTVSREQLVHFLDEEGVAFAQTPNVRHGNRGRQKRQRT